MVLRHVQEQHSGFSYKCLLCHKVLSRAQVHGTCPGRYKDTEIFHRETGARGWLAKQLFQKYQENKMGTQWEERFKAPPRPPRCISPLPRTPTRSPPSSSVSSDRKRKVVSIPPQISPPKKKATFTLDDQDWSDIQLFDPNEEQFREDFATRTKNVWFPPPTSTLSCSSSSSSSSSSEDEEPAKEVKSRVVVVKKKSSAKVPSEKPVQPEKVDKKPNLKVKVSNNENPETKPQKSNETHQDTENATETQNNAENANLKPKPSVERKSIKAPGPSESEQIETKTPKAIETKAPKVIEPKTHKATKNSKDSGKDNRDVKSTGKAKLAKKPKPTDTPLKTKDTENTVTSKVGKSGKSPKERTNKDQELKIEVNQSKQEKCPKIKQSDKVAQEAPKDSITIDIETNDNIEQDETAQAVAVIRACMSDERASTSAASEEEGVQFDQPMRVPQAVNGSSAQHEESEFYHLVKDAIMSNHSEDTILTNPNVPGNDLSDKINHYYSTFNLLQRIQESKVILNIGGQIFVTSELTLRIVPNSLFGLMFANGSPLRPSNRMFRFDRDPSHFRIILMYLRNGAQLDLELLPFEKRYLLELLNEARFYCLEGLVSLIRERLRRTTGCDKY